MRPSIRRLAIYIGMGVNAVVLAQCDYQLGAAEIPPVAELPQDVADLPLTCATDSLQAVTLVDPPMWGIASSVTPTLKWTYPDPTCSPQGYAISLSTGPDFADELGGGTGSSMTSWAPGSPLQPGKEYQWRVTPINGTTLGPPSKPFRYFFTPPVCPANAIPAPVLLTPPNGGTYDYTRQSFKWEFPGGCIPERSRIDITADPTFVGKNFGGEPLDWPMLRYGPGEPLADCTKYYWRVAGRTGSTLGPYSPVQTFYAQRTGILCKAPLTSVEIGPVGIEKISADVVYVGQQSCGPNDVTITARATAPKEITAVILFYRFQPGSPPGEFSSMEMKSIGGGLFESTLNPTALMGGAFFDQSTLQYQVVVQQSDGDITLRTPVIANIAALRCGSGPAPRDPDAPPFSLTPGLLVLPPG